MQVLSSVSLVVGLLWVCHLTLSASASNDAIDGVLSSSSSSSALGNDSTSGIPPSTDRRSSEYLKSFVQETSFYNDLVLFFLPSHVKEQLSHVATTWLRNYVAGCTVYFLAGGLWSFYIYTLRGTHFFKPEAVPSREAIVKQMIVSMKAMPLYVSLPTLTEYFVENGYTQCYSGIFEHGIPSYFLYTALYWTFVEFWVYWMHRWLHEVKPLYKYFHAAHHIYNKQNTLSPFASLAFHPIDGIIQACPHLFALFVIPTHFTTHLALLFLEGLWTTNIHDNIDENIFPVMGAAYHTIHHTTYKHNYGHYTIVMDYLFGTLREPERQEKTKKEN